MRLTCLCKRILRLGMVSCLPPRTFTVLQVRDNTMANCLSQFGTNNVLIYHKVTLSKYKKLTYHYQFDTNFKVWSAILDRVRLWTVWLSCSISHPLFITCVTQVVSTNKWQWRQRKSGREMRQLIYTGVSVVFDMSKLRMRKHHLQFMAMARCTIQQICHLVYRRYMNGLKLIESGYIVLYRINRTWHN